MNEDRHRIRLLSLLLALILAAASSEAGAAKRNPLLHYADAPGVEAPPPPAGKASLILLRPSKAWGGVVSPVRMDQKPLTLLTGKTASVHVVEPGTHQLEAIGESTETLQLELAAGTTYHVLVDPEPGKWNPRFVLSSIDDDPEDARRLAGWLAEVVRVEAGEEIQREEKEQEAAVAAAPAEAPAAAEKGPREKKARAKPAELPAGKEIGYLSYPPGPGVDLDAPPADRAAVVFLRVSDAWKGVHSPIYDGDRFLSFLAGETAFVELMEPGAHEFLVLGEDAEVLTAKLEGGRTYFVLVSPDPGKWRPRFAWTPLAPGDASWRRLPRWLGQVDRVEPTEAARAWAEANREALRSAWMEVRTHQDAAQDVDVAPEDGILDLAGLR